LLKKAFSPLLDVAIDESDIEQIKQYFIIKNLNIHNLKTRKSGKYKFAELHLNLNGKLSLEDAHAICDEIEKELEILIPDFQLTIHVEPE